MRFRAFVAAEIVPGDALVSVLRELKSSGADLKVVRPELLHITLKFLGDVEEAMVDEILRRIATATQGFDPFVIKLRGLGAFPSMSNIRVVWSGIEDAGPLEQIARGLDELLGELGFERDRKGFSAHVTLARTRSGRRIGAVQELIRGNALTDYGAYPIGKVILMKSVLSPQGPTYHVVREQVLEPRP